MVPMRDSQIVAAFHELEKFMVCLQVRKEAESYPGFKSKESLNPNGVAPYLRWG